MHTKYTHLGGRVLDRAGRVEQRYSAVTEPPPFSTVCVSVGTYCSVPRQLVASWRREPAWACGCSRLVGSVLASYEAGYCGGRLYNSAYMPTRVCACHRSGREDRDGGRRCLCAEPRRLLGTMCSPREQPGATEGANHGWQGEAPGSIADSVDAANLSLFLGDWRPIDSAVPYGVPR